MPRPRKFYVHLDIHKPPSIHHGLVALKRATGWHYGHARFKDRRAAEEYAAWWQYEHPPWYERTNHRDRT